MVLKMEILFQSVMAEHSALAKVELLVKSMVLPKVLQMGLMKDQRRVQPMVMHSVQQLAPPMELRKAQLMELH